MNNIGMGFGMLFAQKPAIFWCRLPDKYCSGLGGLLQWLVLVFPQKHFHFVAPLSRRTVSRDLYLPSAGHTHTERAVWHHPESA